MSEKTVEENKNEDSLKKKIEDVTPEEAFKNAFNLLMGQQYADAKSSFKNFISNYQESNLSGSAHYWLGEIYFLKKSIEKLL